MPGCPHHTSSLPALPAPHRHPDWGLPRNIAWLRYVKTKSREKQIAAQGGVAPPMPMAQPWPSPKAVLSVGVGAEDPHPRLPTVHKMASATVTQGPSPTRPGLGQATRHTLRHGGQRAVLARRSRACRSNTRTTAALRPRRTAHKAP